MQESKGLPTQLSKNLSTRLSDFFSEVKINEKAKEVGFVQRTTSKLQGSEFVDVLMFSLFNSKELSLESLTVTLKGEYDIDISKQGLNQRFNDKSVSFFKDLLKSFITEIIASSTSELDVFKNFSKVLIKDSTSFQLPEDFTKYYEGSGGSASNSQIRIQFEYNLKTGEITDLSFNSFINQDQTNSQDTVAQIQKGELILRDLGYVNISVLRSIENQEAYYLNRLPSGLNVYLKQIDDSYSLINYSSILKQLNKSNSKVYEHEVYIGINKDFKSRLILELLPVDVYTSRLREAVKRRKLLNKKNNKENKKRIKENVQLIKQGKEPKKLKTIHGLFTKEEKAKLQLNGYLTNTDSSIIKQEQVRTIYRIRWQVELIFKAWKQTGEIAKVKKTKIERFETFLFAKLLYLLCNWFIFWEISKEVWNESKILLSVLKTFNRLKTLTKDYQNAIKKAMKGVKEDLTNFIQLFYELYPKYKLEKKKDELSLKEMMTTIG